MKNILLLCAFSCAVFTTTKAQFTTGQKMIGGQLSAGTSYTSYPGGSQNNSSDVTVSISLSRFKSPTVFNSMGISYSFLRNRGNGTTLPSTTYNHGVGIFAERTKLERLANRFYFTYTGSVNASYGYRKGDFPTGVPATSSVIRGDSYNLYLAGTIGLLYQLNDRFIVYANLTNLLFAGYQHSEENTTVGNAPATPVRNNSFRITTSLASGFSLSNFPIGLRYMLKSK